MELVASAIWLKGKIVELTEPTLFHIQLEDSFEVNDDNIALPVCVT